jgi:hypothetical protein
MADSAQHGSNPPAPAETAQPEAGGPAAEAALAGDWSEGLRGPVRASGLPPPRRLAIASRIPPQAAPSLPPPAPRSALPAEGPVAHQGITPPAAPNGAPEGDRPQPGMDPWALAFARAAADHAVPADAIEAAAPVEEPAHAAAAVESAAGVEEPAHAAASPPEDDLVIDFDLGEDAADAAPMTPAGDPGVAEDTLYAATGAHSEISVAGEETAHAAAAAPVGDASAETEPAQIAAGDDAFASPPAPAAGADAGPAEWTVPAPHESAADVSGWQRDAAAAESPAWAAPAAAAPSEAPADVWPPPPHSHAGHEGEQAPSSAAADDWAGPPASGWTAPPAPEAPPPSDWETSLPPAAAPASAWDTSPPSVAAPASDWDTSPPPAAAPASDWDTSPPPAAAPADDWAAPGPTGSSGAGAAPANPSPVDEWEVPSPAPQARRDPGGAAPARSPMGASTYDQMQMPEQTWTPDEARFAPLAPGETLAGDDDPMMVAPLGEPVPGDEDLLVPIEDDFSVDAPPCPSAPVPSGPLVVAGEHRVAVHTRAGRTRRGTVRDVDLAQPGFVLEPLDGGAAEPVGAGEVKAVFFMLPAGEKPGPAAGPRVRVTFRDGRSIDGTRVGEEDPAGFFLVPSDAARTNTRRIFIAREAAQDVREV